MKPGGKSAAKALARAKERAQAEREAAEQRARIEEERRPNTQTLAELSLTGVSVPHDGITQVPVALQARASFVQSDATIILWPTLAAFGLDLPCVEFAGCQVLAGDFVPALPARALEGIRAATVNEYALTLALRKRFMPHADHRGPIAPDRWTKAGEDVAKRLAAEWAHVLHTPMNGLAFVPRAVVEAVVRGLLKNPPLATALIWAECVATHARLHGESARPMVVKGRKPIGSIPAFENLRPRGELESRGGTFLEPDPSWTPPGYSGAVSLHDIAQWCADAAAGGEVEPGALLPTKNMETKTKAAR